MSNRLKNWLLWTSALVWTEALTGWIWNGAVSSVVWHTANAVQYWLNNIWANNHLLQQWASQIGIHAPFASSASSLLWNTILPWALWAGSLYMWWKRYEEQWGLAWAYNGVEKSALTYWIGGLIGWGIWLFSAPLVGTIWAAWLGMYWVKKLVQAVNDNQSKTTANKAA